MNVRKKIICFVWITKLFVKLSKLTVFYTLFSGQGPVEFTSLSKGFKTRKL